MVRRCFNGIGRCTMPRLPARPRRWWCCIAAMSTSAGMHRPKNSTCPTRSSSPGTHAATAARPACAAMRRASKHWCAIWTALSHTRRHPRHCGAGHGGHCAECGRGGGRHLGALLRPTAARLGAGIARVQGDIVGAVRTRRAGATACAARQLFVNSYVKPQWLTHDPARVESDRRDPLITARFRSVCCWAGMQRPIV